MPYTRRRAFAGAGALGAVTAATALLIGTTTGHAAPGTSSAYGAFVTGVVDPPQPYVESTDGTEQTDAIVGADDIPENPLLDLQAATVTAGERQASVELANVDIVPGAELPEQLATALTEIHDAVCATGEDSDQNDGAFGPDVLLDELPLDEVTAAVESAESAQLFADVQDALPDLDTAALCTALEELPTGTPSLLSADLITVACEGDSGTFEIANLQLLGNEIEIPGPDANTGLPDNPLLNLTANRQFADDDGFTVQGLAVSVADGEFEAILGSATCGQPSEEPEPKPDPETPTATKPAPTTTQLPVTG